MWLALPSLTNIHQLLTGIIGGIALYIITWILEPIIICLTTNNKTTIPLNKHDKNNPENYFYYYHTPSLTSLTTQINNPASNSIKLNLISNQSNKISLKNGENVRTDADDDDFKYRKRAGVGKMAVNAEKVMFPSIYEDDVGIGVKNVSNEGGKCVVDLTVVVPAYNEELRLGRMLDQCVNYLLKREFRGFKFEVVVVDDGSNDKTSQVCLQYCMKFGSDRVRLLRLNRNKGKGGAVASGVARSRGKFILMADADGATTFSDIDKLENMMGSIFAFNSQLKKDTVENFGVVIGSRFSANKQSAKGNRSFIREFLTFGFNLVVELLCVSGIRDTQCGFKLFSRAAARRLFYNLHINRWAFDCELLFLANKFGIPIKEVEVEWKEIEGSKLNIVTASAQMLRDLVVMRICYAFGVWNVLPA